VLALVLLTLGVVAALYSLLRRRATVAALAAGALLCWVALAFAVALLVPGASYLLVWPLFCALGGMALFFSGWGRAPAPR